MLMAGHLVKRGNVVKSWKKRWFVLQDNGLLQYFKTKDSNDFLGTIDIGDIMAARFSEKNIYGSGFAFEIVTNSRTFYLIAEDEEEMKLWVQAIGNAKIMREHPSERIRMERPPVQYTSKPKSEQGKGYTAPVNKDEKTSSKVKKQIKSPRLAEAAMEISKNDNDDDGVWLNDWGTDDFDLDIELSSSDGSKILKKSVEDVPKLLPVNNEEIKTKVETIIPQKKGALRKLSAKIRKKDIEAAEKIVENNKSKQTESISTNSVAPKVDEPKEQTKPNEQTIENNVKKENEKQKKLEFVLYGKRRPVWQSFRQRSQQIEALTSWFNYRLAETCDKRITDVEKDLKDGVLFATLLKHLLALEGVVADINLDSINNDDAPDVILEHKPRNPLDRLREFFKAMKSSNASKHAYLPPTINSAGIASGALSTTLDCIWAMILMFEVGEGGVDALLQWHADNTHQTSDDVADRSLPASILINGDDLLADVSKKAYTPLDDQEPLNQYQASASLRRALQLATKLFGLPLIMDADAACDDPDQCSAIVLLALWRRVVR